MSGFTVNKDELDKRIDQLDWLVDHISELLEFGYNDRHEYKYNQGYDQGHFNAEER